MDKFFSGKNISCDPRTGIGRILLDCTETFLSGQNTGIQRVVINIVERSGLIALGTGVPCIPVIAIGRHFYPLHCFPSLMKKRNRQRRLIDTGKGAVHRLERLLKWNPSGNSGNNQKLVGASTKGGTGYSFFAHIKQFFRTAILKISIGFVWGKIPIVPRPDDVLLMPDLFWGLPDPLRAARVLKSAGGRVLPVIYDLIPLQFPQFCQERTVWQFRKALPQIVLISSGILTLSKSTQKDLDRYLLERLPEVHISTDFFYPGDDSFAGSALSADVSSGILMQCWNQDFYMMVGTIQLHKGHLTALDAFEEMWGRGFSKKLLIAGSVGGKGDEVMRRLTSSRWFGKNLIVCHNASDKELDCLYRRTAGLIMASFAEGFGLPLIEAMKHAVPIIASDLPVFREIGGDYPEYFSVGSPIDLERKIANRENNRKAEKDRHPGKWLTWDESVFRLVAALHKVLSVRTDLKESNKSLHDT